MNKILLTSAAAIIAVIGNANADITTNNNSPDCDSTTLGVESGATNLEAQWQANTITLNWYDNDTQFTPLNNASAGTCTYDGALTVPSDTLSKTGYTFDGWTIRAAAVCNNLSCIDASIPRISTTYKVRRTTGADLYLCVHFNYDTRDNTASCSDPVFNDLAVGEWKTGFNYGTIKGTSVCKNGYNFGTSVSGAGSYVRIATSEQINAASSGGYCWCRITKFNDNDVSPLWLYSGSSYTYGNNPSGTCNEYCAGACESNTQYGLLLAVMFGQEIEGVADCSSITSSSECARSYPTTGYRRSYGQGCIWSNGACYNQQVNDCSTITEERRCGDSAESSEYYCTWADDHCESYWDE